MNVKQIDVIVEAFKRLGGESTYAQLYAEYEKIAGGKLSEGQKAGIRKNIEDHSSDSANYKGKQDLFYSVYGLGEGVCGLR